LERPLSKEEAFEGLADQAVHKESVREPLGQTIMSIEGEC
jgi:hypothetical protein